MIGVFGAVLLALVCACRGNTVEIFVPSNEASEGGSGPLRDDGDKRRPSSGARGSASASAEDDTADFPEEIAGSFLTCGRAEAQPAAKVGYYGCRVERNSQVVNIETFSPSWVLEDGSHEAEGELPRDILKGLPVGSAWQVEVRLPLGQEKDRRIRVLFDFGDGRKGSLSRSLSESRPYLTMAQSKVFHVGDRTFLLPLLTTCGLQVPGATMTDKVVAIKLTIEGRKTAANVSLGGLCGVNYESNTVTLKSATGDAIARGALKAGGRLFSLPIPELEPGIYQLEVASGNGSLGYDDFLIGEVMATVTDPQAKIKLEPLLP